ncbi:hypothetical protein jhhlp_002443 [Lomentospora prolificans]|uniref:BZIP domain-containing protein n=1 Tax=Lomentospora prolificans TaxID=41688 RepID=A0A2N3NE63_9PEZI|nr:hypothetical protein jhhlp_002443 [Lomentospora prolificans]
MSPPSSSASEQQPADNPTAIRIRDNQRRSRARHREFVETLQRKVQEYERQGVQATLEMQRAARDVAIENARLRTLLTQKGVSEEEIEGYLVSLKAGGESALEARRLAGIAADGSASSRRSISATSETSAPSARASISPGPVSRPERGPSGPMSLKHLINDDDPSPHTLPTLRAPEQPLDAEMLPLRYNPSTTPRHLEPHPYAAQPRSPTSRDFGISSPYNFSAAPSPHEMPCNTAAQIIAGAHGHGDERRARQALGCQDTSNCMVKNTTVFRVLEDP